MMFLPPIRAAFSPNHDQCSSTNGNDSPMFGTSFGARLTTGHAPVHSCLRDQHRGTISPPTPAPAASSPPECARSVLSNEVSLPEQSACNQHPSARWNTPEIRATTEVSLTTYVDEIVRSGFPGLRPANDHTLRARLDGYIDRIAHHGFDELGRRVRKPAALRRWLRAYAAATSTTAAYEVIRDAATAGVSDKPAKTTTMHYRDVLERLWILDPISAWLPSHNPIARLTTPAKHHLVDTALAARLLGFGRCRAVARRRGGSCRTT